ncbi:hypothetical protein EW146_g6218 [Bondarzewia mesenterica]|uniref:Uncharacterized protein n=1 Tax=Bondarzewia mesenterica TaxID=1095465 RepID=A0A4S4LR53_9AGAM|nr:hypothetical protein EW146_g6218 [Bondarzewia mesenterica]
MLAGATVALSLQMIHYNIGNKMPDGSTKPANSFVVDIEKIRVIPPPETITPKKRKLVLKDTPSDSSQPFKKQSKTM